MKKLLLPVLLCTSTLLFAQKRSGDFIKEHLYVKISPTLFTIVKETDLLLNERPFNPAIFGAIGAKMRYAALGFSTGYLSFKQAGPINPLGVDLTITDFKQKVFPVITMQWHKAAFTEAYDLGAYYSHHAYLIRGKDMFTLGAGGTFQTSKRSKILVTAGVSRFKSNTTISSSSGANPPSISHSKDRWDMFFIAASIVL